ncbi:cupin domain-containing protein [Parerythrobacter aurantius]|uniref:cupin domain-containing protein n=1 Tax=Parerythrobacter aurantius TaxID=3127706 RepID=UPI003246EC43
MTTAEALIERLELQPHPEGGWYAETWRAPALEGERASSTAIHFLLEAGQSSHWHRVDAAEIWLWHAGDPLELSLCAPDEPPPETLTLGADVLAGQQLQKVIPPGWWQAARPLPGPSGFALVSCVVAPGFDFAGFELAAPDWSPGR